MTKKIQFSLKLFKVCKKEIFRNITLKINLIIKTLNLDLNILNILLNNLFFILKIF